MTTSAKLGLFGLGLLLIGTSACEEEQCAMIIPEVTYERFTFAVDSVGELTGTLTFSFLDCDGDIGALRNDSMPNVFVDYVEFLDNEWVVKDLDFPNNFKVPRLEPNGNTDKLEGEIDLFFQRVKQGTADTIRFELEMLDRAGNRSNRLVTPAFIVE
ncbi:MAG: hypothetical protein AAGB22_05150 [Bacteroidota bacterium]